MTFTVLGDEFLPRYIEGHELSAAAVAVHVTALLKCVSCANDGIISSTNVAVVAQLFHLRQRGKVIDELVRARLWTDLGDGRYRIDWTHQKTAAQVERDDKKHVKRQADYRERDSRCKAGDHSMCAGTRRSCQGKSDGVTDVSRAGTIPGLSSPVRKDKDEDKAETLRLTPASSDGPAPAAGASGPAASSPDSIDAPTDASGRVEWSKVTNADTALTLALRDWNFDILEFESLLQETPVQFTEEQLSRAHEHARSVSQRGYETATAALTVGRKGARVEIRLNPEVYKTLWRKPWHTMEDRTEKASHQFLVELAGVIETALRGDGFEVDCGAPEYVAWRRGNDSGQHPPNADNTWPITITPPWNVDAAEVAEQIESRLATFAALGSELEDARMREVIEETRAYYRQEYGGLANQAPEVTESVPSE